MWDGEVIREDTLLYVRVDDDGQLLTVYRSVVVKADGRLFAPVAVILSERCTEVLSAEETEDESMMFGQAVSVVRRIWSFCPGPDYPHRCKTAVDLDEEVTALVERKRLPQG